MVNLFFQPELYEWEVLKAQEARLQRMQARCTSIAFRQHRARIHTAIAHRQQRFIIRVRLRSNQQRAQLNLLAPIRWDFEQLTQHGGYMASFSPSSLSLQLAYRSKSSLS